MWSNCVCGMQVQAEVTRAAVAERLVTRHTAAVGVLLQKVRRLTSGPLASHLAACQDSEGDLTRPVLTCFPFRLLSI